ncbi:MAG: hypothetical protein R3Y54_14170 [Eubacteriales bacterium]
MYKATKLLKVVAVIFIVTGVFGAVSSLTSRMMLEWSESITGINLGLEISTLDIVLGTLFSVVNVVSGIIALLSKYYKVAWGLMGAYIIYTIYSLIISSSMVGFNAFSMISFVLPALYLWGLYTSKIEEDEENL